jgi:nucleotide-binding universal stress UspA family protein
MATEIKRILVPYDFDELSPRALDYAVDLAKKLGASIDLFHVAEVRVYGPDATPFPPPDVAEQLAAESLAELQKVAGAYRGRGVAVEPLVRSGSPWEEIVRAASARPIDLVVMASHGRRGLAHALHGSVAEKVLRLAPCPVLAVRGERWAR